MILQDRLEDIRIGGCTNVNLKTNTAELKNYSVARLGNKNFLNFPIHKKVVFARPASELFPHAAMTSEVHSVGGATSSQASLLTSYEQQEGCAGRRCVDAGGRLLVVVVAGAAPASAPLTPLLAQVTIQITSLYILWTMHSHC